MKNKLIKLIKKNDYLYSFLKKKKAQIKLRKATNTKYTFINRSTNSNKLCIVLAGYKSFLYEEVFSRISEYVPNDVDVCIVSSGVYSEELLTIAEKYNFSYLSTKRNCVTMAQNLALSIFESAQFIYKIDEDIFVTKNFFNSLANTYDYVNESGEYNVGFVAPLIPINGYGHYKILEKLDLLDVYQEKFERPRYEAGPHRMIENSPEVAKFMWGKDGYIPPIDTLDEKFSKEKLSYSACPIRFSIGAIYFEKQLWKDMGMFIVNNTPCMGVDEEQMCSYCITKSKAIIVSENTVVGHLSFGTQNQPMKEYYLNVLKEKS